MNNPAYKFGIYINRWSVRYQQFGIGLIWTSEKYIHFNLFNFELAIGKTAK